MTETLVRQPETKSAEAQEALYAAEDSLYSLVESPQFAEKCLQAGIDPIKSVTHEKYWGIVGDMAEAEVKKRRADGESELNLASFELLALTPSYLHAEESLETNHSLRREERKSKKELASYYNGLLRYIGGSFEGVETADVLQSMGNTAAIAGMTDSETTYRLNQTVRGAKNELAFGQLLDKAGFTYYAATVEQDLRGIDYVVEVGNTDLSVDVKASLSEVEALGGVSTPFAMRRSRDARESSVAVMYSMVSDKDFEGKFVVPDELAASRAPILADCLQQASLAA